VRIEKPHPLMNPAEVADALRVDPKTVTRWARAGKLSFVWTPGGHRRYYRAEVMEFVNGARGGEK
jgi:excisionase family DNA binding protein